MVTLELENKAVKLIDTAINLKHTTAVFDVQSASRQYSLPFRVSAIEDVTEGVFNNLHRIDAETPSETKKAKLYVNNKLIFNGLYAIEKANKRFFDGNLKSETKDILEKLAEKQIHDLLATPISIPQTLDGVWELTCTPPNYIGQTYYMWLNGVEIIYSSQQNDTAMSIVAHFRNEIATRTQVQIGFDPSRLDVLILRSTGQEVRLKAWTTNLQGFTLTFSRTWGEARRQNFEAFMSNQLSMPHGGAVAWCMFSNPNAYENNTIFSGLFNYCYRQQFAFSWNVATNTASEKEVFTYSYIPFVRIGYILTQIAQYLNISQIEGDFFDFYEIFREAILYNNFAIDEFVKEWRITGSSDSEVFINVFATQIDLRNHVQNMTCRDFLNKFCEFFNLEVTFEANKMIFKKLDSQLSQKAFAKITKTSDVTKTIKQPIGIEMSYLRDENDSASVAHSYIEDATTLAPISSAKKDSFQLKMPYGILPEQNFYGAFYGCYANQKIKSAKSSSSNIALRIGFDRGSRVASDGKGYYPMRSTTYNNEGMISLLPNDIFERFWKRKARILAYSSPISFNTVMQEEDFFEFQTAENATLYVETEHGNAEIAVKDIEMNTQDKKIKINAYIKY